MQVGKLKIHYTYNDKKYEQLNDMLSDMTYEDLNAFYQKTSKALETCEEKRKTQLNEKVLAKCVMIGGVATMIASPIAGGILKSLSMLAFGLATTLAGHYYYKRKNIKQLIYKLKLINLKYMQRESSNEIIARLNGTHTENAVALENIEEKEIKHDDLYQTL